MNYARALIVTSQIAASNEKMYHDAYTLQRVEADNLQNFNFVSGMVPFLLNLILDVSTQCFTFCRNILTVHVHHLMRSACAVCCIFTAPSDFVTTKYIGCIFRALSVSIKLICTGRLVSRSRYWLGFCLYAVTYVCRAN